LNSVLEKKDGYERRNEEPPNVHEGTQENSDESDSGSVSLNRTFNIPLSIKLPQPIRNLESVARVTLDILLDLQPNFAIYLRRSIFRNARARGSRHLSAFPDKVRGASSQNNAEKAFRFEPGFA
jgi:hypothetical protein